MLIVTHCVIFIIVLSVEMPTGAADLELPSGLTTLLSCTDDSLSEARNSTTISGMSHMDPSSYFEGDQLEEVEMSLVGLLCDCGKLFIKLVIVYAYFYLTQKSLLTAIVHLQDIKVGGMLSASQTLSQHHHMLVTVGSSLYIL